MKKLVPAALAEWPVAFSPNAAGEARGRPARTGWLVSGPLLAPRADTWLRLSASNDAPLQKKSSGRSPKAVASFRTNALAEDVELLVAARSFILAGADEAIE